MPKGGPVKATNSEQFIYIMDAVQLIDSQKEFQYVEYHDYLILTLAPIDWRRFSLNAVKTAFEWWPF